MHYFHALFSHFFSYLPVFAMLQRVKQKKKPAFFLLSSLMPLLVFLSFLFVLALAGASNKATFFDGDFDGVPDSYDLCPNTKLNSFVDRDGCDCLQKTSAKCTGRHCCKKTQACMLGLFAESKCTDQRAQNASFFEDNFNGKWDPGCPSPDLGQAGDSSIACGASSAINVFSSLIYCQDKNSQLKVDKNTKRELASGFCSEDEAVCGYKGNGRIDSLYCCKASFLHSNCNYWALVPAKSGAYQLCNRDEVICGGSFGKESRLFCCKANGQLCNGDAKDSSYRLELKAILEDIKNADFSVFSLRDSLGQKMDTIKVAEEQPGHYFAVYHTSIPISVYLAESSDLRWWQRIVMLEEDASQPTIAKAGNGWLVAFEKHMPGSNFLALRYYNSSENLRKGLFESEKNISRSLTSCSEGTPNIFYVSSFESINSSLISLGFHFHKGCDVDRNAIGQLTNWDGWKAHESQINSLALQHFPISGNIGDRDYISFRCEDYIIFEAQDKKADFSSWGIYLYDLQRSLIERLNINTGNSELKSFGNPSVTMVKLPDGSNAVVASYYVFANNEKEGPLYFYRRIPD